MITKVRLIARFTRLAQPVVLATLAALACGLSACKSSDSRPTGGAGVGTGIAGFTGGAAGAVGGTGLPVAGTTAGASAGAGGMGALDAGLGAAGTVGQAGTAGAAGAAGAAGMGMPDGGMDAMMMMTGNPETGRLVGITAAHNKVRANVSNPMANPPLPPLTWSADVAKIAQAYAEKLASSCVTGLVHSGAKNLGENLAASFGGMMTAQDAVDNWASEVQCWTYGTIGGTEKCDMTCAMQKSSNGCGHYTQLVSRNSLRVGCGVASCGAGAGYKEYWVCNYDPPGNVVYKPTPQPPY